MAMSPTSKNLLGARHEKGCSLNPPEACCNLCGHCDFLVQEDSAPPFRVLKCRHCGLVFVYPFPALDDLACHYDEIYYRPWLTEQKGKRDRMWRARLDRIESRIPSGHLLDVGCGDGSFLQMAQKKGWKINGTEFSPYASQFVAERLRCNIHCGDLTTAGFSESTFDVVTMWHVLEHVRDPMAYLIEIQRILKPGGWLILAVPNVKAFFLQLAYGLVKGKKMKAFSKNDREIHLYHFSTDTLRAYLIKAGFSRMDLVPDTGIVDHRQQVINGLATLFFRLSGRPYFNAIEAWAVKT